MSWYNFLCYYFLSLCYCILYCVTVFCILLYSVLHPYFVLCPDYPAFCRLYLLVTHNTHTSTPPAGFKCVLLYSVCTSSVLLSGILTRNPRMRSSADLRLRSFGHWARQPQFQNHASPNQGFHPRPVQLVAIPTEPSRRLLLNTPWIIHGAADSKEIHNFIQQFRRHAVPAFQTTVSYLRLGYI
jgi:hypothetical protein